MKNLTLLICILFSYSNFAKTDPDVVAKGKIYSTPVSFSFGHATIDDYDGSKKVNIKLFNGDSSSLCKLFTDERFNVRLQAPLKVGAFNVTSEGKPSFVVFSDLKEVGHPSNNIIAYKGVVKITEIADDSISGEFQADASSFGSAMSGKFQIPLCK